MVRDVRSTPSAVLLALMLAPGAAQASDCPLVTLEELQDQVEDGRFEEATCGGRRLLEQVQRTEGEGSLAAAQVMDWLVDAVRKGEPIGNAEAWSLARRSLEIKQRLLDARHLELAVSLNKLGVLHGGNGEFDRAMDYHEQALAIRQEQLGPDHPDCARVLNDMGNVAQYRGDYREAERIHRRVLAIRERTLGPEHLDVASSLNNLAKALFHLSEFEEAREMYERSLAIRRRQLGNLHPEVGRSLNNLGMLLRYLGAFEKARETLEEALAIRIETLGPDHPYTGTSFNDLGLVLRELGEYDEARSLVERALRIWEAQGPEYLGVPVALANLGDLSVLTGDYASARPLLERALALYERIYGEEHTHLAVALVHLGELLSFMGDYTDSAEAFERAISIFRKAVGENSAQISWAETLLGNLRRLTGDYEGARRHLEDALLYYQRSESFGEDNVWIGWSHYNLGLLLRDMSQTANARQQFERALRIYEASVGADHPYVADTLTQLGMLIGWRDEGETGAAHLERALTVYGKSVGPDHPTLARALDALARIKASERHVGEAIDLTLRADRLERDRLRLIAHGLPEQQALLYSGVNPNSIDLALDLLARGLGADRIRDVWDAAIRSRAAILDEVAARRLAIVGTEEIEQLAEALTAARQRLVNLVVRGPGEGAAENYRALVDRARGERDRVESRLAERSLSFRRTRMMRDVGYEKVTGALPTDSALVAYLRYDEGSALRYLAIVLQGPGRDPVVVPLGAAAEIEERVAHWKSSVSDPPPSVKSAARNAVSRYRQAGAELRRRVWDPVAKQIGEAQQVFIVPDGGLNLVSFATLPDEHGGYLVESGPALHYLSAERDLVPSPMTGPSNTGLLAIGGPEFDHPPGLPEGSGEEPLPVTPEMITGSPAAYRGSRSSCQDFAAIRFRALPGTRVEVDEIAQLWSESDGGGKALSLTGPWAHEGIFKRQASSRRVLHLATHGFLLEESCQVESGIRRHLVDPTLNLEGLLVHSGLALAGANRRSEAGPEEEDGILTAEEIASLDLSGVEWAVLSACHTGSGKVLGGEGVFGLRRAFAVAGVDTLIMSLWSVQDEPTRQWMRELYAARLASGLSTAQAVRRASLAALEHRREAGQSDHPFYWGAFVAAGDWQ
jgi:tetratricopeptide (TPR) repeat protein